MPIDITANYIRIRVASPKGFIRMRIKTLGKGIKAVIGFRAGGGSQIQSVLFPKSRFSLSQAKAWIKSHGYTVHESYLVTNIEVGKDFIDIQETLITPEIETELLTEEPKGLNVKKISKEDFEWLVE